MGTGFFTPSTQSPPFEGHLSTHMMEKSMKANFISVCMCWWWLYVIFPFSFHLKMAKIELFCRMLGMIFVWTLLTSLAWSVVLRISLPQQVFTCFCIFPVDCASFVSRYCHASRQTYVEVNDTYSEGGTHEETLHSQSKARVMNKRRGDKVTIKTDCGFVRLTLWLRRTRIRKRVQAGQVFKYYRLPKWKVGETRLPWER